jgi:hypothetical protein
VIAGLSTGDGLACLAFALIFVGTVWAAAWASVRNAGIRAEALRRLGEGAWTAKTTARRAK